MIKCHECGAEQEPGSNCILCGASLNLDYPNQNDIDKKPMNQETKIWERFLLVPFSENVRKDILHNDYNKETNTAFIFIFLLSLIISPAHVELGSLYPGQIPIYTVWIFGLFPLIISTIITAGIIYLIGFSLKRNIFFNQIFHIFVNTVISSIVVLVVYVIVIRNFPVFFISSFLAEFFFTIVPLIILIGFFGLTIRTLFKIPYIFAFLLSALIIIIESLVLPLIFNIVRI